MIFHYLKSASRSIGRNKIYTVINVLGLAIGMACTLLIVLFVKDELSYDRYNANAANIYRVVHDFVNYDGTRLPDATSPAALAPALQKQIPEVLTTTRVYPNWGHIYLVKYGEKKMQEERLYLADSSFFDIFTQEFVKGNAKTALADVKSIVITASTARKYFGADDPINKTLTVDGFGDMKVSAVIKDVPANSHFHFDFLASFKALGNIDDVWGQYNYYTYLKTRAPINTANFGHKIQTIYDENNHNQTKSTFWVQPVTDIHLKSSLKWELESNSDILYVYIFTLIAVFIVLIASINYINLTTATASARAKEIGVRKVIGGLKKSIVSQLLTESVLISLMALACALCIAQLILPMVNEVTGKQLSLTSSTSFLIYALGATLLLGIIAGVFPALYMASFKPVMVLKGFKSSEKGALNLRKTLVVVQFTISIVLIIGAIVISQQMQFIRSAKLGLTTDKVLVINKSLRLPNKQSYFNEISKVKGVKKIAFSQDMIGDVNSTSSLNVKGSENKQLVNYLSAGVGYFKVMGIEIKEGRGFSDSILSDTLSNGVPGKPEQIIGGIVLNETAVKDLAIQKPVIGKEIYWGNNKDTMHYVKVVGVVKDFHFTSMRNKIKPFAFIHSPRHEQSFTLKLSGDNISGTIKLLKAKWNELYPDKPFQYTFMDETFAKLYQSDARFQKVFISLVILGIFIASLGLFALATFAAQQRVKEIGIRKVLGASVINVVGLLSKDFLKLVIISLLIAAPVGWYAMNNWLHNFAYQIHIKWWVFPLAGVLAIIIALVTISFQAIKAAIAKPVKSLRTE
ncbi:ABC transporter permease [Mucilaginibacter sp. L3T2-6]|uniref:ABC transporter permease n=1 Tax=Mucilaginibacter sp. L3T2-6 TaxID=3062491 RepID=UPI002674D82B|nr:ABC transporter permease [Mucilaginibacter sp. L3T2-6]MDO3644236.1 ABC transporter permease [Mucilaginibacter sp. L3T2-6]MDV6216667.1 ABC transporter permease [Mucilaginibacter sp. L3T2-6]